jgi:hypothetical protein
MPSKVNANGGNLIPYREATPVRECLGTEFFQEKVTLIFMIQVLPAISP